MVHIPRDDMTDFDPENPGGSGFGLPSGKYHVEIEKAEEDSDGVVIVEFKCLAGTVEGQEGNNQREYFYPAKTKAVPRFLHWVLCCDLSTAEELQDYKDGKGGDLDFEVGDAESAQLFIETETQEANEDKDTGKKYKAKQVISWGGMAHIKDEQWRKEVPINKGAYEDYCKDNEEPDSTDDPTKKEIESAAVESTPAASEADPFSDIT